MVMVLCPANARISLIVAPAIASHERNVCRLQCHTYPVIFASTKQGTSHDRVSKRSCFRFTGSLWSSRGNNPTGGFLAGVSYRFNSSQGIRVEVYGAGSAVLCLCEVNGAAGFIELGPRCGILLCEARPGIDGHNKLG